MTVMEAALAFHAAGCCPVPARTDGTKAPVGNWKEFQSRRPEHAELTGWFGSPNASGIGVVCGAISGGLELLEWEARAMHLLPDALAVMAEAGLGDLWNRIIGGYVEFSPTGGIHVLYRVAGVAVPGNTHLARRPSTAEELAEWKAAEHRKNDQRTDQDDAARMRRFDVINATTEEKVPQVLIETRGEGGFVIVAPSAGTVHPSGRPWLMHVGDPSTIPTITAEEHKALWAVARTFDQMPARVEQKAATGPDATPARAGTADEGLTPGEDWAARTSWPEILEPHGWTVARVTGRVTYWCRPGKDAKDGSSERAQGRSVTSNATPPTKT